MKAIVEKSQYPGMKNVAGPEAKNGPNWNVTVPWRTSGGSCGFCRFEMIFTGTVTVKLIVLTSGGWFIFDGITMTFRIA
jgi:hypothetical protein